MRMIRAILTLALILGATVLAAGQAADKKAALSLNFGLTYDNESEELFNWTIDARAGFRLGQGVQISPEVMYAFAYGESVISPGVIFNYVARRAFFGGGLLVQFRHDWWDNYIDAAVKINIGYAWRHLMVTAYYIGRFYTDAETELFGYHQLGFNVGYRF